MFESFTLVGIGWLMLVLCAVRAGLSRSWRERIDAGRVQLDARPARPDSLLRRGQTLVWRRPPWDEQSTGACDPPRSSTHRSHRRAAGSGGASWRT